MIYVFKGTASGKTLLHENKHCAHARVAELHENVRLDKDTGTLKLIGFDAANKV